MTIHEAEQYLLSFSNLPRPEYLEHRHRGKTYLEKIQFALHLLGNPEKKIPHYIHVAGTSGKGSIATYLASVLSANGHRTALMISPHPSYMRERWQIGGKPMPEKEFVRLMKQLKPALDAYTRADRYDALSLFDLQTIIGLMYFAEKKVAWAVIEVGLGGRYDSTNVIPKKDIAVITSIGLDHTELLGNTKEKIAAQKAGIITPRTHVFTMEQNKPVLKVMQKACARQRAEFTVSDAPCTITRQFIDGTDFIYGGESYRVSVNGIHQVSNACLVVDIARHLKIEEAAIKRGLRQAVQPLRLEVVSHHPMIILDGAHNPDKMKTTVDALKCFYPGSAIHLVVGFSADKDWKKMTKQLAALHPSSIACTRNTVNPFRKVADPAQMAGTFKKFLPTSSVEIFLDPNDAFAWSKGGAKSADVLLVTGSIFLSGELRGRLQRASPDA